MKAFCCFKIGRCSSRFVILFAAASFLWASGQTALALGPVSPFLQRVWQSDQGLPHDSVHAILQTRDGYLWIGTRRGVARFDGARFRNLEMPAIGPENVSSLCEDRNGNLWIGTESGLVRWKSGEVFLYNQAGGLAGNNVRTIYEDKDGSVWIGTATGLSQFRNEKIRNFSQNDGLPGDVIRSLCNDEFGNLWIATDGGLTRRRNGVFSIPDSTNELGRLTRVVYLDHQRDLWVGTQNGLFRKRQSGWERFDKHQGGLSDDFINVIYSDHSGQLWIGTYGGLNRLLNGKFVTELTSEGAAYDLVNAIFEDREGNVWIGSKEGLTRLRPRPLSVITKQQGLTYNNVMSVLEDRTGNFWCGTWGGGLFQFKEGRTTPVRAGELGNSRILSLCERRDGSLWFGLDFGEGLYELKNGRLTHYDEAKGLERAAVRTICEDRDGNLWVGTSVLNLLRNGEFARYSTADGIPEGPVRVIYEDREGSLWVGTGHGLARRKNGEFTSFGTKEGFSRTAVLALYQDRQNDFWIGTGGNGLIRWRNGQFRAYTTREGMFNDEVLEILEDDHGYLWMSCLKGIFRIKKTAIDEFDRRRIETIPCTAYGKDDGMISIICNNVSKPAAWKGSDGRLWFATTKGVVVADPNIKANGIPPPIVIEEIVAEKQMIYNPFSRHGLLRNVKPSSAEPLEIPPGRGTLEIHYTVLSFTASERNRFRYRLEGVDPDWVDAGARRVAYYNNIAPGDYRFHVIGCNNDGTWNSSGASVELALQPHYWQTGWFKSLAIMGSLSLAAAGARFATRKRMVRKLERLEQQHAIEKERSRIARDMHDDLGARLSEILLISGCAARNKTISGEVKIHVERISQSAREVIDNLDGIVWAVDPKNDTLDIVIPYVHQYVESYLKLTSIRCRLDVPDELPRGSLSSEARHNFFMVVKEALHNVAKYAEASEVLFRLRTDASALLVWIDDNGKGFSLADAAASGNGLGNMSKRMKDIGGSFEAQSELGKGTRIALRIPIKTTSLRAE